MSKEKLILNEDLATPADSNIPSLAREICAVSALHKLNEEMLYKFKVLV